MSNFEESSACLPSARQVSALLAAAIQYSSANGDFACHRQFYVQHPSTLSIFLPMQFFSLFQPCVSRLALICCRDQFGQLLQFQGVVGHTTGKICIRWLLWDTGTVRLHRQFGVH